MRSLAHVALAAACVSLGVSARHARADDMRVVLARTGPAALVLWNASPLVSDLVATHRSDASANDALERGALRAAAFELPSLAGAKSIAVRVLFDKTGAVSPVYGEATFAGVERYAIVTLDGPHALHDANRWQHLRARDPIPRWITYRVIGTLPPR